MSMFLILPDQVDPGVRDLELNITTSLIKDLMATLQVKLNVLYAVYTLLTILNNFLWKTN
jgi:hypothetical protein